MEKIENVQKLKERGITLIALVITIIVLLILAGVTISMLTGDSGILSNAEKAKEATRLGNIKEELQLWQATALMDEYINTEVESTDELLERLVKQKTISKEEKEKLATGESITVNGEEISLAKITAGIKVGDLLNASNKVIGIKVSDGAGNEVPIPTGFYYVGGTVNSGVVISDSPADQNKYKGQKNVGTELEGNQYVWVPCTTDETDTTSIQYKKDTQYNDGTTATKQYEYAFSPSDSTKKYTDWKDAVDTEANEASVSAYGGFYVGRYEAGVPSNASFYADEQGDTYSTAKNVTTYKPVSKANNPSWNYISQTNAKTVSNNIYGQNATVRTSLIDSYAWDTIVNWMEAEKTGIAKDSTKYGNYYNTSSVETINGLYAIHTYAAAKAESGKNEYWSIASTYSKGNLALGMESTEGEDSTNYTYQKYKEIATGSLETAKVKNIYDMAGNMSEWTTEQGKHKVSETEYSASTYAVRRGGNFNNNGDNDSVSYRYGHNKVDVYYISIGFRVVLYVK